MPAPDGVGMKQFITILLIATSLSAQAPATPSVTVVGTSDSFESEALDWAIGRYEAVGIGLPEFIIEFAGHDDCGGNTAVAIRGRSLPRIVICAKMTAAPEVVLKRTLLHEIAHIWAEDALDEATRVAFLELRGLESWSSIEVSWQDRGSEQAAEIMTWALMDRELLMATLSDHDPDSLAVGFELLTGTIRPPRSG